MAACERCGAVRGRSGATMQLTLRTPNGQPLYLQVSLMASSSPLFATAAFFCERCFVDFVAMVGQSNDMARAQLGQTPTA